MQHVDHFIGHLAALAKIHAVNIKLFFHPPHAGAEDETILSNMRRMAHIEEEQVFHVHCSIGMAMITGDNLHYDEVINQADIACREAKSAGRNRLSVYEYAKGASPEDNADVGWMNRLRRAVDNDEFELRFQPINRIHTGETTHHEVLIRLRGDDDSIVFPDAFLPSAMRFGLMTEIDFWMIEPFYDPSTACRMRSRASSIDSESAPP